MSERPAVLIYHPQGDEIGGSLVADVPEATVWIATTHEQALAHASQADAIFALDQDISREMIAAASRLRWIQALTSGTDSLDGMAELNDDVIVTSMHGVHGPQVSELAILFMLALARRFPAMLENQRSHTWDHWRQVPLYQSTVTIVGMGAIGRELARRCKAFEMNVLGVDALPGNDPQVDRMFAADRLHEALHDADFVVLLVPHLPETHHLMNAAAFLAMRRSAYLVNVARGAIVDEAALLDALERGVIAGAGLDVFAEEPLPPQSPLWNANNVLITPHVGGDATTYVRQMRATLALNTRAFVENRREDFRNVVRRRHNR
jgi:phosphoglycerate dehydrogenase-like enzyme